MEEKPKRKYPRPEDALNIGEAATRLGLSRSQFYPLRDKIPHIRYSKQGRYYLKVDVDAWKLRHTVPGEE